MALRNPSGQAPAGEVGSGAPRSDQSYNIEVVCRTHSADGEPSRQNGRVLGSAPAKAPQPTKLATYQDAVAAVRMHRRRKAPKNAASVYPVDADDGPAAANGAHGGPGADLARSSSVFDLLENGRKSRAVWKQRVAAFLDGVPFTIISIIFTVTILYASLICAAATPPSADPYFLAFTIFAIVFFLLEILVSSLAKPVYFGKFYFFMDVVASLSLLCQVPGFMDAITGSHGDGNPHTTLDRAAKSAQAGARAARIMQVIALISLLRIKAQRLPFASGYGGRSGLTDDGSSTGSVGEGEGGSGAGPALLGVKTQSRIGEKVTERTMRKVILGVLLMLLVLPVFDASIFFGHPTILEDGGLAMLHGLYQQEGNSTGFCTAVGSYIEENVYKMGAGHTGYVYRLKVYNITLLDSDPDLRKSEKQTASVETPQCSSGPSDQCYQTEAWVDIRWAVRMQALLDIGRITFLLAVLSLASVLFIRDADELVLQPIERMVSKVKSVSQNPLAHHASTDPKDGKGSGSGKQLETRILEQSISKICSLLSVGFGEAGAEVIADNIKSGGDLNPMVPGRKVTAIFGFCDIRQFTDTTEVLEEEIMEFVNSIASIVHMEVSLHGGAANKNIGDAFLLVWKLPGSHGGMLPRSRSSVIGAKTAAAGPGGPQAAEAVTHLADAALASFIIIQAALKRSSKLTGYTQREDLNSRIPEFAVKMGFGLHVGWAIEGAIGSKYKIDASYLSPHVNMAARLEAATKQFGVPILLSEPFVALLSPAVRRRVRQIDCVTVKGSRQPIGLFTYDVTTERVATPVPAAAATPAVARSSLPTTSRRSVAAAAAAKFEHESFSDYPYYDEFEEHPDILATKAVDEAFLARFGQGFALYRAGNWREAAAVLEETLVARRTEAGGVIVDGPSETLLAVMREHKLVVPVDWGGYRELTEK